MVSWFIVSSSRKMQIVGRPRRQKTPPVSEVLNRAASGYFPISMSSHQAPMRAIQE
jgi:hypothetical protein